MTRSWNVPLGYKSVKRIDKIVPGRATGTTLLEHTTICCFACRVILGNLNTRTKRGGRKNRLASGHFPRMVEVLDYIATERIRLLSENLWSSTDTRENLVLGRTLCLECSFDKSLPWLEKSLVKRNKPIDYPVYSAGLHSRHIKNEIWWNRISTRKRCLTWSLC
jgi:hypothetical protein